MASNKSLSDIESRNGLPRPLGSLVLIREEKIEERTPGGIIRPQITRDTQFLTTGIVLAVGEGFYDNGTLIKPNVKAGDRVLYPRTSSNVFKEDGSKEDWVFIPTGNLIAVLGAK